MCINFIMQHYFLIGWGVFTVTLVNCVEMIRMQNTGYTHIDCITILSSKKRMSVQRYIIYYGHYSWCIVLNA